MLAFRARPSIVTSLALLALAWPSAAQEADGGGAAAAAAARDEALAARVAALEEQLDDLDDDEDEWQIRIHGGWVNLEQDYDEDAGGGAGDAEDEDGWVVGFDLFAPVWRPNDDGDDDDDDDDLDLPLELYWRFTIDYLHIDDDVRDPTTGEQETANAIELLFGPVLRFPIGSNGDDALVVPYVYGGVTMLIASLPWERNVELDMGAAAGLGLEFRVTDDVGIGVDYRYVWYGVADAEEFDHHTLTGFIGFYF